ncbi:MAG TPA: PDZ domain-containing protein, partial [Planctomycetaceae bacterium]|nr:PDZ domain-containing protein [Planctomycetaceae bacterium]
LFRRFLPGTLAAAAAVFVLPIELCSLATAGAPNGANSQASIEPATTRDALREAVLRLNSPRFTEREAASQELFAAREPAIAALLEVAKEGSLEAAVRAVGILEAIYVSSGEFEEVASEEFFCEMNDLIRAYLWVDLREAQTTADAAEFALDELERIGRPAVSERSEVVLQSHYDLREQRAIVEIVRLHGKMIFGGAISTGFWNPRINPAMLPAEPQRDSAKGRGELTTVIIGPKWVGGDDGLKQVARLKRLRSLYRIEGKQVTDNGILRLRAALPGLEIQVRAAAKLGIEHRADMVGNPVEQGCKIETVKPGEAAANAGLRSQDVILRFAGQTVVNFDSLIEILHHYNPGDIVEATISRNEELKTVQLTLTGWD